MIDEEIIMLPDYYPKFDISYKIIVIGDSFVGKSCLTSRATQETFDYNYNSTIGFGFFTLMMQLKSKVMKLQIWDTCGQEVYRSLARNFYRSSSCAIIVFSIDE